MNLSNELTELLEIEYPIVQAPMGGESTPSMSIAVSNAAAVVGRCGPAGRDRRCANPGGRHETR